MSPVFRKVDNLSEEESVYHTKISRVQQGIEGKVAVMIYKWSYFYIESLWPHRLKHYGETIAMERHLCTQETRVVKIFFLIYKWSI